LALQADWAGSIPVPSTIYEGATMPRINVRCKKCGKEFMVGDFLPPSKKKCPKCKQVGPEVIGYVTNKGYREKTGG